MLARRRPDPPPEPEPQPEVGPWPPARIALTNRLWGEGFTVPGGAEDVLRLATPLGLSAASSLLLVGCGAGGPARCIATLFGAWVAGYESDPALVAEATAICARAGLGKRVRIDAWDPAAPAFPPNSCHHVLALDPFRHGPTGPILDGLIRALRTGGQITLLATVAGPGYDPAAEETTAWVRLDGGLAALPTEAFITQALAGRRCDVRVVEDLSTQHMHQTVRAWRGLVHGLGDGGARPPVALADALVREAELWLRRARLIRAGNLRWVRWHAMARVG
ncbi:MAG: hypothetical protein HIU82_05465 [Proteobacteria bacterium]|nr:hypothetical protein [Pseudomonadota bacterium]